MILAKIKNMDPNTKMLVKAVAIHIVIAGAVVVVSRALSSSETEEN